MLGAFKINLPEKASEQVNNADAWLTLQRALLHKESMDFVQHIKTVSSWAVIQLKCGSSQYSFSYYPQKSKYAQVLGAPESRQAGSNQSSIPYSRAHIY